MCGGGGGSSPPDYTQDRADLKNETLANYQSQADAYNTSMEAYNAEVQDLLSQGESLSNTFAGATYDQLYDNPNTAENESLLAGDPLNQAQTLQSQFDALQMPEAPVFDPVVMGEGGIGAVNIGLDEMPTLIDAAGVDTSGFGSQIDALGSTIANLQSQGAAEEARLQGIYDQYNLDTANTGYDIGQLGMGSNLGGSYRDLNTLEATLGNVRSPIAGFIDFDGDGIAGNEGAAARNQISNWRSQLDSIGAQTAAENQRISDFGSGLYTSIDQGMTDFGALGGDYTKEAEISALMATIAQKEREINRFSSPLGGDFSGQRAELNALKSQLQGLITEGDNERTRVQNFIDSQGQAYEDLYGTAMDTGIYSKAGIDALGLARDELAYDTANFSTPFGDSLYNPENVGGFYRQRATDAISGLGTERQSRLDAISNAISGATSGLSDVPLYDEDAIRDYYGTLDSAAGDFSRFSGGRVDEIQAEIDTQRTAIDGRINELRAYRTQLEEDAQALLEEIESGSYYGLSDLDDPDARALQMNKNIELYNAQQALDEIAVIEKRLEGQRQRLELDAANVAARTADAQQSIQIGASGTPTFGRSAFAQPATETNMTRYNPTEEEEDNYLASRSPFSTSLGAIQIGG